MRVFIPLAATTAFAFNYGQPNQPFDLEEPHALKAAPGRFNSPDAFAALNVYSPYHAADETRGLTTAGRQGARPFATKAGQPNRLLTRYYRGNYGHSARRFGRAAGRFAAGGLQGAVESDVGGKAGKRFAGRYETSGRRIGGKVGGVVGGALGGAAGGVAGGALGSLAGPAGTAFGSAAGGTIGAAAGTSGGRRAGTWLGGKIGRQIDKFKARKSAKPRV
ncbi:hypothetical protein AeMF1_018775 [Aphanomyces euteiches]|nr:hypothetical protein AeMF1_018775 [Aphanomyces euteiches]KAH9181049.1 hypothetical protein AeNC1_016974 [Aphanomyces euteiches]